MKYITNNLMKDRLQGRDLFQIASQKPLETRLQKILDSGVSKIGELVLLNKFKDNLLRASYPDFTGREMFINKFHIDEFSTNSENSREEFFQQGVAFALALRDELIKLFPNVRFKIIASTDEGPDAFPDIFTVGFHTIRPNEHWLTENLEDYKMNGLLVIDT